MTIADTDYPRCPGLLTTLVERVAALLDACRDGRGDEAALFSNRAGQSAQAERSSLRLPSELTSKIELNRSDLSSCIR